MRRTLAAVVLVATACGPALNAQAEWSQYRGDPGRTARVDRTQLPAGVIDWRYNIGENAMHDASPVVDPLSGAIYVGTTDIGSTSITPAYDRLYALRPDGSLLWRSSPYGHWEVRATPAVVRRQGLIVNGLWKVAREKDFITNEQIMRVGLLDASRNAPRPPTTRSNALTSPLVTPIGVFTFSRNGVGLRRWSSTFQSSYVAAQYLGVELEGNEIDWCDIFVCFDTSGVFNPNLMPELGASPAYSGTCNDLIVVHGAVTRVRPWGEELWDKKLDVVTTPAVGKAGVMYAGVKGGKIAAFNQDGSQRWRKDLHNVVSFTDVRATEVSAPVALGFGTGDAGDQTPYECKHIDRQGGRQKLVRDHRTAVDSVYVPTAHGELYRLNHRGEEYWRRNLASQRLGAPVVIREPNAGREFVVIGAGRRLYAIESVLGTPAWTLELDSPILGSPAVANQRLYVATQTSVYSISGRAIGPRPRG